MTDKIFHIYVKDRCVFHSLSEEEFNHTWNTLNNLVGIMRTDYTRNDLSYEELPMNKKMIIDSSH
jgi:hypothetical protein